MILVVIIAIAIAAVAVVIALKAAKEASKVDRNSLVKIGTDSSTSSTNVSINGIEAIESKAEIKPVRKITYRVKLKDGTSASTSRSLQGTSTSTVTKTFGAKAGDGKVVTSKSELETISPGIKVRFSGIVSYQNTPLIHKFAAYVGEEFRGLNNSSQPIWSMFNAELPALIIDLAGEDVQLINSDYGLTIKVTEESINGYIQGKPMFYPQEDNFICDETTGEMSQRYCGLELGSEVVVTGTVTSTENGIGVVAENITSSR